MLFEARPAAAGRPWRWRSAFCARAAGGEGGAAARRPPPAAEVALERAFPRLAFARPVALLQEPGAGGRWFAVEKAGRVRAFPAQADPAAATLFADISGRVESAPSEAGLLGLAFHPGFATNGEVFLSYTAPGAGGGEALVSRVSRFLSRDGGDTLDAASEEILLSLSQPFANHNGGQIAFGPDGFLYAGFGDGGGGGDPEGNGQNTQTLLGAFLRLDVDGARPYAIPADNPFAQGPGRPEIYAWGFRNPWRWSFDRLTGDLWCGDVGQNQWEEVDRVVKGGNYGWNLREGTHCFADPNCSPAGLVEPAAEYSNGADCSVTGGYVYRGTAIPGLQGTYLYGDFCSGRVWGLGGAGAAPRVLLESGLALSSFAEGNDGEVYLLDYEAGTVHRLVASTP